jgi:hypothetical protein
VPIDLSNNLIIRLKVRDCIYRRHSIILLDISQPL